MTEGKLVAVAFGAALTRMELFVEEFERLATNPAQTKAAGAFRAFVTELVAAWESKPPEEDPNREAKPA